MTPALTDENRAFARRLLRLAPPIMLQEFIVCGAVVLVTLIVGTLGVYAITAVGIANRLYFLFQMTCFGINTGCAALIGQFWGKNDIKGIHGTMGVAFVSGLACAGVFACIAVFATERYMLFFSDGHPEVVALGARYLRIVSVSFFINAVTEMLKHALRGVGETRIPVLSSAVTLVTGGFLCWLFIVPLNMGVEGAALALVVSRALELAAQIALVIGYRMPVAASFGQYFKFNRAFVFEFFKTAAPIIADEATWAVGTMLYTACYAFTGAYGQGAVQIAYSAAEMFQAAYIAVGSGCGVMIANAIGAGDMALGKRYAGKCLRITAAVSVGAGCLLAAASPLIAGAYNVPGEVMLYARQVMLVFVAGMVLKGMNYAMIVGIMRNGGDTAFCLFADFVSVWFVALPLAYVCARFLRLPVYGVALAVYSEEAFKFVICALRVRRNKWARNLVADL